MIFALEQGLIAYRQSSPGYLEKDPLTSSTSTTSTRHHDIYDVVDPKSTARFLRNTPSLGKVQLGEFISKGPADLYPFHAAVLREYADTFDFSGTFCYIQSWLL